MRIYLDNCAYNRPYDDSSQFSVYLEAQAKIRIQEWIREKRFELVTSEILMKEINDCPSEIRKKGIIDYIYENSSIHVGPANNNTVHEMALEMTSTGIKYKDACHLASAIIANVDFFITTDKRLLKFISDRIRLVNPVDFISIEEDKLYE